MRSCRPTRPIRSVTELNRNLLRYWKQSGDWRLLLGKVLLVLSASLYTTGRWTRWPAGGLFVATFQKFYLQCFLAAIIGMVAAVVLGVVMSLWLGRVVAVLQERNRLLR